MAKKKSSLPLAESGIRGELIGLLQANTVAGANIYDVFRDWVEISAISLARCDLRFAKAREDDYMRIVGRYKPDQVQKFGDAFGALQRLFERCVFADVLGDIYMNLEIGSRHLGQHFTPYYLSQAMAAMALTKEQMLPIIEEKGFVSVLEPACGSGGMVVAAAEAMLNAGFNPQTQMHAVAIDIDSKATHMAYIQCSLLGLPAAIYHGDTLALKTWSEWLTPMHLFDGWPWKLHGKLSPADAIGELAELLTAEVNPFAAPAQEFQNATFEQLGLFQEAI